MAVSHLIDWDVRTTAAASNINGGGFKQGATGADFSQQDAAQYALTGVTSSGAGNVILSASAAADMVGNILNVVSGTNFNTGRFEITSVSVGVSITCSTNNAGAAISTGVGADGVINIGGSLLTLAVAEAAVVAGNIIWWKVGTYTITTKITLSVAGSVAATGGPITWQGYDVTHGDATGNKPVLTSSTSSVILIDQSTFLYRNFRNCKFTHTGATRGIGFSSQVGISTGINIYDCIFDGLLNAVKCDNLGSEYGGAPILQNCDIINCTGAGLKMTGGQVRRCRIMGNAVGGIATGDDTTGRAFSVSDSYICGNTGSGITLNDTNSQHTIVSGNEISGNSVSGIVGANNTKQLQVINNVLYGNGAYGLSLPAVNDRLIIAGYNAFGANVTAARLNITAKTGDVTLTADPYTNSAGGDYSHNNTAGGGAALNRVGTPQLIGGGATDTNTSIGAYQAYGPSAAGGGGASILRK